MVVIASMLAGDPSSPKASMKTFRMVMVTLSTKQVVFKQLFCVNVLETFPPVLMCRTSWQNILMTYTCQCMFDLNVKEFVDNLKPG